MTKIMELDSEWKEIIDTQLEWVDQWIFRILPDLGNKMYKGPKGRIKLLQLIIDCKFTMIIKSDTVKLRCLGAYFGQAIVEITGWPWKVVEDKYGVDIAIQIPERKDWIFPITMISKRIENDEHFSVKELFDDIVPLIFRADSDGTYTIQ